MSDKNLTAKLSKVPGFYGKLPILGDFVSRRLPHDFIRCWDSWLQNAIANSKAQLGAQWLEYYLTSPVWRFVLSPGIFGNRAWAGVVISSVDRVGRYFPFTIALAIEEIQGVLLTTPSISRWFVEIEEVALTVLDKDLSVNEIDKLLFQIDCGCWFHKAINSIEDNDVVNEYGKKAFYLQSQHDKNALLNNLLALNDCLINNCFANYSLWQTNGSENAIPTLLICEGLPPVEAYSGLLCGQMSGQGWSLQKKQVNFSFELKDNGKNESPNINQLVHSLCERNSKTFVWQSQSAIDIGKRRKHNEDALLDRPEKGLWVVADGMGGHQAGDVASSMIVNALDQLQPGKDLQKSVQEVSSCLYRINNQLRQLATNHYHNQIVGSTVVVLIAGNEDSLVCVWAGDSRLYRLRNHRLQQMTVDHCETMDESNDVSQSGIHELKVNNVITRAIGAFDQLELDYKYIDCQIGDKFLLCSDGVDKELSRKEIEEILIEENENDAEALMQAVLVKQASDNVSIIVINTTN